jgi:DNA-binding transcriptional regulator LsrR (DeoR family)
MKIKQLLRLYTQEKSKSYISDHLGISRNTVAKYITAYIRRGLTYDEVDPMSDLELISLFEPEIKEVPLRRQRLYQEYKKLEKELTLVKANQPESSH